MTKLSHHIKTVGAACLLMASTTLSTSLFAQDNAGETNNLEKGNMVQEILMPSNGQPAFEGGANDYVRFKLQQFDTEGALLRDQFNALKRNEFDLLPPFMKAFFKDLKVGNKVRYHIPAQSEQGLGDFSVGKSSVFDIEVVDIVKPYPAPEDVSSPPSDAIMLEDGVAYKVLQEGFDEQHPTTGDDVVVHYTGWQANGKMFGSTRLSAQTARFPLGRLIAGWQSAVPTMTRGSKMLVWIPGDLAYDKRPDRPTAPKGMLIFEIELFDFYPSKPAE